MVDYIPLTCDIEKSRPDALGNMTISCSGNYFYGSFGKEENTLSVQCGYMESGSTDLNLIPMEVRIFPDWYYATTNEFTIQNFDQNKSYTFTVFATDKLNTVTSTEVGVKSIPVFHWGENDFIFEVPVEFRGGVIGLPTNEGGAIDGFWSPSLNANAVSSYTTQIGIYSKVGQVVTVGFYIKATCKSGYHETPVKISGLPFTPLLPNAGGGMASRTLVPGGMTFQCFVAETTGEITTRVQGCGHEVAGNLATSASGCCYQSGGGEITLSGTITYITNS